MVVQMFIKGGCRGRKMQFEVILPIKAYCMHLATCKTLLASQPASASTSAQQLIMNKDSKNSVVYHISSHQPTHVQTEAAS